jgi:hypothetical protein
MPNEMPADPESPAAQAQAQAAQSREVSDYEKWNKNMMTSEQKKTENFTM